MTMNHNHNVSSTFLSAWLKPFPFALHAVVHGTVPCEHQPLLPPNSLAGLDDFSRLVWEGSLGAGSECVAQSECTLCLVAWVGLHAPTPKLRQVVVGSLALISRLQYLA